MKQYKQKEFSEMLNVSVKTLQRWDTQGVLPAYRNPKGRRYYTEEQY
ncbi:IS607 family transposase, partial [Bacillus cereus]